MTWVRIGAISLLALLALPLLPATASAVPRLQVTPNRDVDPAGQKVRVRGSGYDENKGIYVAWCVVPPKGQKPTPCGGGEDRDGSSGSSVWISSFPPAYGVGLAEGYDEGGTFDVEIVVSRFIGEVDCFKTACAVTTRNDHERTDDRSQDVFAPVRFRGQDTRTATAAPRPTTTRNPPAPAPTSRRKPAAPAAPTPTQASAAVTDKPASQPGRSATTVAVAPATAAPARKAVPASAPRTRAAVAAKTPAIAAPAAVADGDTSLAADPATGVASRAPLVLGVVVLGSLVAAVAGVITHRLRSR